MRASPPALLAAGRLIMDSRDDLVAEWAGRLGDRITAAPTIPRSTVERELRLLVDILAQMIGPLRREARPMWRRACEQYGRNASTRGLSAGEVVEEMHLPAPGSMQHAVDEQERRCIAAPGRLSGNDLEPHRGSPRDRNPP